MPRRIEEDHQSFRKVVSGRIRKALKKFIKSGEIVRHRGKNGKISISIPKIDTPHIIYGDNGKGIGRGPGKPGDVVGKDPEPGQANGAGQGEAEGITINLDLEEVLKFMEGELELPKLKPKLNETFEETKIKYNDISLIGPESLRHTRRTIYQAMKRMAGAGELDDLHIIPGMKEPMPLIEVLNQDKRYRQYKEIKIPSSNAVIIFARDGSGSMDATKCEIVSDMAWWIDVWIRRFYKRVERMWVWHDSAAMEVDEEKFYNYRFGGGTTCSSALKLISQQFDNRFPPEKWNIYVFYFTDGDNWTDDNSIFIESLSKDFAPNNVNFVGITQIMPYNYNGTVKYEVDEAIKAGKLDSVQIRTASIDEVGNEEERNVSILNAIRRLLGNNQLSAGDG